MKITITRGEGISRLCGIEKNFKTFKDASNWLVSQSDTFPKLGYDKHDFSVTFDDENSYSGRLDCKHHSKENNDLDVKEHVIRQLKFWLGENMGAFKNRTEYEMYLEKNISKEEKEECKILLKLVEESE